MRSHIKLEVLSIINTLVKAANKKAGEDDMWNLLADCQECAIQIGELIESSEGEGHITVKHLEEYAELLYLTSQAIGNKSLLFECRSKLLFQLDIIKKSVEKDIVTEKRAVFLPYKVEMWDSMESIWKAAEKDSEYECYVIPIPYTVKNNSNQINYEGESFSSHVPIHDYREVNLEKLQPDVIFIHNPFDQNNNVSSVLPAYYSDELAKVSEFLVYIPYYICTTKVSNEQCLQEGVLNADLVILQSEEIKKQFQSNFNEIVDKNTLEEKFVSMGSPKVDRLIASMRGDITIPSHWKEKSKDKKVVLFNTHLNALINAPEKMLYKIKYVFEFMKARNDLLLLWRPHPLSLASIQSMRMEYAKEYEELVKEYREEGWGIYDDSPDFYPAFILSDAYYGNSSSLLALYGMMGKPICLMNTLRRVEEYSFSFGTIIDGWLWTVDYLSRKLYKINLETGIAYFVISYQHEDMEEGDYVRKVVNFENKLFLIPAKGKFIVEYNISEQVLKQYYYNRKTDGYQYAETFVYGYYLYVFPVSTENVLRVNVNSGEISYMEEISDFIKTEECEFLNGINVNDKIYLPLKNRSSLFIFDMQSGKYNIEKVGKGDRGYVDAVMHEGFLYLLSINGQITIWNPETRNASIWWQYAECTEDSLFTCIRSSKNHIWIFPHMYNKIIKIEKDSLKETSYTLDEKIGGSCLVESIAEEYLLVYPPKSENIYIIDWQKESLDKHVKIQLSEEEIHSYLNEEYQREKNEYADYILKESEFSLHMFIQMLTDNNRNTINGQKREFEKLFINSDGSCGEKTWYYVKQKLDADSLA